MKRNQHEWTKRTPDGRRVYRAWTERGEWKIQSALEEGRAGRRRTGEPGSSIWENEEPPSLEILRLFREVLWNKYQRGRVAYKLIEKLDAMIEDAEKRGPVEETVVETEPVGDEREGDVESAGGVGRDDDGN